MGSLEMWPDEDVADKPGGGACPVCGARLRQLASGSWFCDECELTYSGS